MVGSSGLELDELMYRLLVERARQELSSRVIGASYAINLILLRVREPKDLPLARFLDFPRPVDEDGEPDYEKDEPRRKAARDFVWVALERMVGEGEAVMGSQGGDQERGTRYLTLRQEEETLDEAEGRLGWALAKPGRLEEEEQRGREIDARIKEAYRQRIDGQVAEDTEILVMRAELEQLYQRREEAEDRLAGFDLGRGVRRGASQGMNEDRLEVRLAVLRVRTERLEKRIEARAGQKKVIAESELRDYLTKDFEL
jgi:hypothetical protein